jgi:hypothetical protein
VRWLVASLTLVSAVLGPARATRACPPSVRLGGDPGLVAELTPILASRGIGTSGDCPALPVSLQRRGRTTVVSQGAAERLESREVNDVRTAATVIESWVRTDLDEPLLARRRVADAESPDELVAAPVPEPPASRRLQVFTLGETSVANDRTAWVGFQMGACAMFGPVCLGGRLRFANVAEGPDDWEVLMARKEVDALLDVDAPRRVGHVRLSTGAAFGLGWIGTHEVPETSDGRRTLGLRLEPHATASYSLSSHFAVESNLSVAVNQTIHTTTTTPERLPADPRFVGRIGLGLRFEGP